MLKQHTPPHQFRYFQKMTTDIEKGDTTVSRTYTTTRDGKCTRSPKTTLERLLLILFLAVSVLCAVLTVFLVRQTPVVALLRAPSPCLVEDNHCANATCPHICISEYCVKAAATLLNNMDATINPCDDFYQFACGNWHIHHSIPPDTPTYDTFSLMKDEMKSTIRDLLEAPITDQDSNATINAKNLYASCMNEELIEKRKEEPLKELLEQLGGWPIIMQNWTEDTFDWVELMAQLRLYNNDILVGEWVGPDGKNSSLYIIQLDQADVGLPSRDYYIPGSQQMEAYLKFMIDIAVLLGASVDIATTEMEEVLYLEMELANITIPNEERRNYSAIYNKMSVEDLQMEVAQINWTLYFNLVMPMEIPPKEEIVVYALSYLKAMGKLIEKTPKRVVANYILWRFIYRRTSNLDKRFIEKQEIYFATLYGTRSMSPRWKSCATYVNKNMGMAVGSLFVKTRFSEKSKETAEEMIEDIKSAFLEMLDEVAWMTGETRQVAKAKAELITQKIGYPEYINNPLELDRDYEGVEFKPDTYFENVLNSVKHYALREQLKLRNAVDKTQWVTPPAVVNAFYTRSKNFISLPAGIFQPPLYHQTYPKYLNYGGIGVVIGHEIIHGFDDKGRQFDQHGNLKQWWNPDSLLKFQTKAECMVKQYGNYILEDVGMKINGINTQGENIADNGGVKQTFRAYRNWEFRHGSEPLLPGLNLTRHQLFFLNYAQIWCGVMTPEAAVNVIRTGTHSPGKYRVIGALSNSKDFAEAYNCPLGSNMNPSHKCEVW